MSLEEKLTDVPQMWKEKPEAWWDHLDNCEDCSQYHARPSMGDVATASEMEQAEPITED